MAQVAEIVEERVRSSGFVSNGELARLLSVVRRKSLFALVSSQLLTDVWSLITLYRGGYPDEAIEKTLIDLLRPRYQNDSDPSRRYIVEAMRDVGTAVALPALEAILYDPRHSGLV